MDSYDILVAILSAALAVFLVLAIIFTIYLIRIARTVKSAADSMETAANIFKKSAGPAVFSRIVANVVETWKSAKGSKKKE